MTAIIPFSDSAKLPAYLKERKTLGINKDVASAANFGVLSIKGKVFTLVRGSEKKVLTRPDDPDEVLQNIQLVPARINMKSRVFYAKAYAEGESDGAKPTCFSHDGVAPDTQAAEPQAKKCAICPHAQWGSKTGDTGKGTACAQSTRMAVIDPENPSEPYLLRVPPASRANLRDAIKIIDARKLDYNQVVFKIGFDKEAPSPKLTFKPVGLVNDELYAKLTELYEDEVVQEIVGTPGSGDGTPTAAPPVEADELDAALAAKKATDTAKAKATAPAPAPAPAPAAAAPAPAPKPAAKVTESDDLLGDLDKLLSGGTDD